MYIVHIFNMKHDLTRKSAATETVGDTDGDVGAHSLSL